MITLIAFVGVLIMVPTPETFAQGRSDEMGGGPPPWAPAHGYRAKTRHLYFPEHNFYYDMHRKVYIYMNAGTWSISAEIPTPLKGVNLSASKQIELDLTEDKPQTYNSSHKVQYGIVIKQEEKGKSQPHPRENGKGKGNGAMGRGMGN